MSKQTSRKLWQLVLDRKAHQHWSLTLMSVITVFKCCEWAARLSSFLRNCRLWPSASTKPKCSAALSFRNHFYLMPVWKAAEPGLRSTKPAPWEMKRAKHQWTFIGSFSVQSWFPPPSSFKEGSYPSNTQSGAASKGERDVAPSEVRSFALALILSTR